MATPSAAAAVRVLCKPQFSIQLFSVAVVRVHQVLARPSTSPPARRAGRPAPTKAALNTAAEAALTATSSAAAALFFRFPSSFFLSFFLSFFPDSDTHSSHKTTQHVMILFLLIRGDAVSAALSLTLSFSHLSVSAL